MILDIIFAIILATLLIYVLERMDNTSFQWRKKVIFVVLFGGVIIILSYANVLLRLVLLSIIFIEISHRYLKVGYFRAITSGVLGLIFVTMGDVLSLFLLHNILGFSLEQIKADTLILIFTYLIIVLTVMVVTNLFKKLNTMIGVSVGLNIKNSIISLAYIITTLLLIGVIGKIYEYIPKNIDRIYIVLFLTLIIIFMVINFVVMHLNIRYVSKNSEYEQLRIYTGIVENLVSDVKKFRHDYVNIIASINGYIENEDIFELKKYFNKEIIGESKILYNNNNMLQLQNIKNPALKGLISSKIVQAENLKINLTVEILGDINNIPVKTIDLCKILGVIIDNSIEAAVESNEKIMKIGMMDSGDNIILVVSNTYNSIPKIRDIFKEGFSTKGENRGIGLSTIKEIIDNKYNNILLNTFIENRVFKQEINIRKTKKTAA